MKIENIKNKQTIIPVLYPYVQEEKNIGIESEQISGVEVVAQNTSLREQILAIQKVKALLSLESLAASELSEKKYTALTSVTQLDEKFWSDYNRIHCSQETLEEVLLDMKKLLEGQSTDGGVTIGYYEDYMNNITDSLLVRVVECRPTVQRWGCYFDPPSRSAQETAAQAMRIMIEKVGDTKALPSQKESKLIKILLNSSIRDIREQGAIAARNTYKHGWRKNVSDTGLIVALKDEKDDSVRAQVAEAITQADPVSVFKEHMMGYGNKKFCPVSRLFEDKSINVRVTLAYGVCNVLLAQEKRGGYYEDFSEIPVISAQNRIDAFRYALESLEDLVNKDQLSENEKELLLNVAAVVSESISDNSVNAFNQCCTALETQTIEKLLLRLAQIDLKKFIKVTTHTKFSDPKQKDFNIWNNSSYIPSRILFDRRTTDPNPLKTHFVLKEEVRKMKASSRDSFVSSNLERALLVIDDSVENNVLAMGAQNIKWGNGSDFNFIASNLIDLLVTSQSVSCKLAVLDTFDNLCQNSLQLDKKGQVTIDTALTKPNCSALSQSLRQVVCSEPV